MEPVLLDKNGAVARIVLNRPDKLNSFNRAMAFALQDALKDCAEDDAIHAIVITGNGKAFSAGQDLAEVTDPNGPGMEKILREHYNPIILAIRNMPKPVVAAVNGVAAGAGANIALACDIVLASEEAAFIQAFSKIGLVPDSGGTWFLPRLVGWQRALALAITGDKVMAKDAQQMGMIYKALPAENFQAETDVLLNKLAAMPTKAVAFIKEALERSWQNTLEAQLAFEDVLQQKAAATNDFKEGVAAFLEKRQPLFTGN